MTHLSKITLLFLAFFLLNGCSYNSLQIKEEGVFKAWGNVESTLQRRGDLIPNLVETVKGYTTHEAETLETVISARAKASSIQLSSPMTSVTPQRCNNFRQLKEDLPLLSQN
jgi:LemA protein